MDIFNIKKVEELERELEKAKRRIDGYRHDLSVAEDHIKHLTKIKESIPERCTPGDYCRACEFGKEYFYHSYNYGYETTITAYLCNKGNSCPNFVQKKVDEK